MSDTLSLDPTASYGAGSPYDSGLDPQPGNGFAASSAARFQDALASTAQARDSGNSAPDLDASASVSSAPAEATSSISALVASNVSPQQASDDKAATASALGGAWDWTKHQASAASQAIGSFDAAHGHVLTRAAGAAQAVGAVAEGLAGAAVAGVSGAATATGVGAAPGVPAMIGGGALMANALDNGVAGVRTAWTGEFHHTLTSQAAGAGARALGASDQTAERITSGVDLAQGFAGGGASIAARMVRKGAVDGVEAAAKQSLTKGSSNVAASDVMASEAIAGSVDHVNVSGSTQNCVNCAYSVDNQLATGAKSSALPRTEGVPFGDLNKIYNTKFSGWVSKSDIESKMLSSGDGTRAIVYGMDAKGRSGHVWNAVVQNGAVNYVDGQTGGSALRNFTDFTKLRFGITSEEP